jgi:hypothetical protein
MTMTGRPPVLATACGSWVGAGVGVDVGVDGRRAACFLCLCGAGARVTGAGEVARVAVVRGAVVPGAVGIGAAMRAGVPDVLHAAAAVAAASAARTRVDLRSADRRCAVAGRREVMRSR